MQLWPIFLNCILHLPLFEFTCTVCFEIHITMNSWCCLYSWKRPDPPCYAWQVWGLQGGKQEDITGYCSDYVLKLKCGTLHVVPQMWFSPAHPRGFAAGNPLRHLVILFGYLWKMLNELRSPRTHFIITDYVYCTSGDA